jgi:hypothetical protein
MILVAHRRPQAVLLWHLIGQHHGYTYAHQ